MNILPMIAMLLLILAMGSFALLQESVSTFWEKRSYLSYMKVERRARSEWEQRQFKRTKTKTEQKPKALKKAPQAKNNLPYLSPREKKNLSDLAKINIAPLFSLQPASPSYQFLYEGAANLLRLLYANSSVFKDSDLPHLEYELLDVFIIKGKKKEKSASLADLYPDEPKLQEIYYKILKGTSLESGYPPLSDYLTINLEEKEKAVHFNYAPKIILAALFGAEAAKTVISEEKKKWQGEQKHTPLNKTELAAILQKKPPSAFSPTDLEEIFSFSKKRPKERTFIVIDKETGISSRRRV